MKRRDMPKSQVNYEKAVKVFFILVGLALVSINAAAYITPDQYYDPGRGLLINAAKTKWDFFSADDASSKTTASDQELQFVVRSPQVLNNVTQPTLTMRVDHGAWKSAKAYGDKWLKDFPKFGYELQMARDAQYGNLRGYDIELLSNTSHRHARQFIVSRPKEVWVFTCSSDDKSFRTVWPQCEKILNSVSAR